jgi:Flp pilus assembly protein TadD
MVFVTSSFALAYNQAIALERSGRPAEAAAAFREAVRVNPFDLDALIHLGLLLRELGQDDEANRAFSAALDLTRSESGGRQLALP